MIQQMLGWFWYLDIALKTPGIWQSKLFDT